MIGIILVIALAIYVGVHLKNQGVHRIENGNEVAAGVCAGIAAHYGWNVTATRVLWFLATCALGGMLVITYITLWMILPIRGQNDTTNNQ